MIKNIAYIIVTGAKLLGSYVCYKARTTMDNVACSIIKHFYG